MICFCGFDTSMAVHFGDMETAERNVMAVHMVAHHKDFQCPCKAMRFFRYSEEGELEEMYPPPDASLVGVEITKRILSRRFHTPTHSDWERHFDEVAATGDTFEMHLLFHGMASGASKVTDEDTVCSKCGHHATSHDAFHCNARNCQCHGFERR